MTHRSSIWEPRWSTRRSTWLRIGLKSSLARMPCSWPRSAAVTAWASRHITIYLTQQLTPCVQDAVKARTLWSVLEPSRQEETSLVKWVRRWRSWRIIQERQCWCLGAPCRASVSAFQTSVNNNNNQQQQQHQCGGWSVSQSWHHALRPSTILVSLLYWSHLSVVSADLNRPQQCVCNHYTFNCVYEFMTLNNSKFA